jgi:hypothetical protein
LHQGILHQHIGPGINRQLANSTPFTHVATDWGYRIIRVSRQIWKLRHQPQPTRADPLQSLAEGGTKGKFVRSGRAFEERTGKSTAGRSTLHFCASGFGKLGIERAAHFVGVGSSADQLRTEKTVGKGSKGITATEGSDGFGSCEAHHVGISPQKDRGCSKGKVGKGEGW